MLSEDIKKFLIYIVVLLCLAVGSAYAQTDMVINSGDDADNAAKSEGEESQGSLRYPVSDPAKVESYEDLTSKGMVDAKSDADVKTEVVYDPATGMYIVHRKIGDMDIATPFPLSETEYSKYMLDQSMNQYWAEKNSTEGGGKNKFSLNDIQIGLGVTGDKIFGPGGVKLKMQGSVDLQIGLGFTHRKSPTISERNQKSVNFDFDAKIQLAANGSVGDRIKFNLNYNTEATFDTDQELIKLTYEGKEDDIIKKIDVGNVSLPLSSRLIPGSNALFGIMTELQFGKLKVAAVVSQQESESHTVTSKNGSQVTEYEVRAMDYEENRHYFLSEYFYENYDKWMKTCPMIQSGIEIQKIEVWVMQSRSSGSGVNNRASRNVIAFKDLGELKKEGVKNWYEEWECLPPSNKGDSLYARLISPANKEMREIGQMSNSALEGFVFNSSTFQNGYDYEYIESARLLSPSDYTVNRNLGFISLRTMLRADEVLAVAYEYTLNGKTVKVGEMTTDGISSSFAGSSADTSVVNSTPLFVKLLKSTSVDPENKVLWHLMMKNVYNTGGYNVQEDKFKLEVKYNVQNDSINSYLPYIPEEKMKNTTLLRAMGMDRLNSKLRAVSDGKYDFIEGYTVIPSTGRVILPMVEPFGASLKKIMKDKFCPDSVIDKYAFDELYTMIKTSASEYSEKDKFVLTGQYKSTAGSEIRVAPNITRGSVRVTAGGRQLQENVGFTVDYNAGIVRITDEEVLASNTQVQVSTENESMFASQRKSLFGVNLDYAFNEYFNLGATIMHLSEKPLTNKVGVGYEPISNTIWGLNGTFTRQSNWLTKITDAIPLIDATAPSQFTVGAEFAQLVPGHGRGIEDEEGNSVSYIDDFEGAESSISLLSATAWALASTPIRPNQSKWKQDFVPNKGGTGWDNASDSLVRYGLGRAHFAWYHIDNIFQKKSSSTPNNITTDNMSNHFTRQVSEMEIYQNKDPYYGETTTMTTLNLAYYPDERGMYNLDYENVDNGTGKLKDPEKRWGGMMRKLETTDFEKSNVEYLEFWLLDPYAEVGLSGLNVNDKGAKTSGKLVFNLGEVSEDILHDGMKQFEQGLPTKTNKVSVDETSIWGRTPVIQSEVSGFADQNVAEQDLGLDGLSSEMEKNWTKSYGKYYEEFKKKGINNDYVNRILADPAGDDFHHYRGDDWDAIQENEKMILDRYKYYNGMEGNSTSKDGSQYTSTSTNYPNTEDLNGDGNVNKKEAYYEYVVDISSDGLEVGKNFITNMVTYNAPLKNGETRPVNWYQFRIPIRNSESYTTQGKPNGFNSIRFMRMYMTGFSDETYLRFGSLELTKTEWRVYKRNQKLFPGSENTMSDKIEISSVDIEKDERKSPIGYILPPGIERSQDPSQSQVRMENEKSMRLVLSNLPSKASSAVYKNISVDTRQYERFKMFVHAESMIGQDVPDNRLHIFLRMGSDFTENYYEYMIPLAITPVSGNGNDRAVWPRENEFDFRFKDFTELKLRRNKKKVQGDVRYAERYSEMHGDNVMTVMGNPTFGDVTSIMIGIKNEGDEAYSAEIWLDEMRMQGFNEEGGWAALAEMGFTLSDFASFDITGKIETVGFGSIESNVMDRNQEDTYNLDLSTTIQLGKFFPEKAKVNMPLSISYSKEKETPKYDPTDNDIYLSDAMDIYEDKSIRDSIEKLSVTESRFTSYALTNVRVGVTSKKPMPYDPANFSFTVAYNKREENDPETEYDRTENFDCDFNYNYSFQPKVVEPFKKVKFLKSQHLKLIRDFNFYYLPHSYAFGISSKRFYNEIQTRDYTNTMVKDTSFNYLSWDKDWTLQRTSDIKWNLSKSLKLQFASTTNATVDEIIKWNDRYIDVPRNQEYLYEIGQKEWYELLRDTIKYSLAHFGQPFMYNQRFNATYAVPINKLPYLDWITANATYTADYQWNRGVSLSIDESDPTAGNIAFSKRTWRGDGRVNLETLYNKSNYFKNVNKKFNSKRPTSTKKRDKENADAEKEKEKPKTYERKNIRLKQGNKTRISHRLNTTRLMVEATDKDGKPYKLKYDVIDANAINIIPSEDITGINIVVTSKARKENGFTNAVDYFARFAMMLRNVSANYSQTNQLTLNGFRPSSGFLGFDSDNSNAPGGAFTFGFFNQDKFLDKCINRGWLDANDQKFNNPAVTVIDKSFQGKALIEPYPGFKIDVNSAWNRNTNETYYYQYDGNTTMSGSLSHSDITIKTAFKGNDVNSEVFDQFIRNIDVIRQRESNNIATQVYENEGLSTADRYAYLNGLREGMLPSLSADVLVPAFISAYRGQSANSVRNLNPLPKLWMMLPNWKITFDVLSKSERLKKNFKQFNITHGYKCTYNINSFEKYNDWTRIEDTGYGIVGANANEIMAGDSYDGTTGARTYYATEFTVDNVSFNELFNPLFGLNTTLKNSLRFKAEYKQGRTSTLDVPSLQVVETHTKEIVFGTGYRIDDFGGILGFGGKQKKVNNDLNLNLDASYKNTDAYIRKIETEFSEQNSGLQTLSIQFVAQYVLSEMIKLEMYYQHSSTKPKVSTSFPISNNDVGFRVKLQLTN